MSTLFRPATRQKVKLRMAIDGVSGSGKTFTALRMAVALGKRTAVINTESGAVEKYLGLAPDGIPFQFDVCELNDYSPTKYTEAILAAGAAGYEVLIIDSLSHAWAGSGGALELKDRKGGNSFTAWKDITPMHNQMIEAILHSPCHIIATMRSKTEYVLETDERGRQIPRKMGMAPVQRAGMEYEFDLYCSIDSEHIMRVSKSRCPEVADKLTVKPGVSFMEPVVAWLNDGSAASQDKFAVTEADLRKLAKAESADQPPPPKKTAKELMEEAAARVEGAAAAGGGAGGDAGGATGRETGEISQGVVADVGQAPSLADAPPVAFANGQTKEPEDSISPRNFDRLNDLFARLDIDVAGQSAILQKRGVTHLAMLSDSQAVEIIEKLSAIYEQQQNQVVNQEVEAVASGGSTHEQGAISASVDGPATVEQVAEIKELLAQAEQIKPGTAADAIALLHGAGFAKFADLTFAQARELKSAIEAQNIRNFFDSVLATASAG